MTEQEELAKGRLQKLVEKMGELGYNDHMIRLAKERVKEHQQSGVYCVDKFVQKLQDRVNDKDYFDISTEGRFAIILSRLNFSKIQIAHFEKGPDIIANWNRNLVYFEVTRSRPSGDDLAIQDKAAFGSEDSPENTIGKIQSKLRQLKRGETNIIVLLE